MKITNKEEAQQYLQDYVAFIMKTNPQQDYETSLKVARENIGYGAGYYGNEERIRVKLLFDATHPVFGDRIPTAEESFNAGYAAGK